MISFDNDGITEVSTQALTKLHQDGKILEKVEIYKDESQTICSFIFKDHSIYNASGFGIGYSGEGPRGLFECIKMFDDSIGENFADTPIQCLDVKSRWSWYPKKGFVNAE